METHIEFTKAQRKAAAFICRPRLRFEPGWHENQRKAAARIKAEVEAEKIANAEAGQTIPGQGVFLGQYAPKDHEGQSLGRVFNVFAAPQDLTDESGKEVTFKYIDAVKRIARLKGWHGFDGTNYPTDKEIYRALKDRSYNGGWIIPTRDLLVGTATADKNTQPGNLFAHQKEGSFKGTFKTVASSGSDYPGWYWSSTEARDDSSCVHDVRFSDGVEHWIHKDYFLLSCRPVRLVPA